jgi:hypothetical protein
MTFGSVSTVGNRWNSWKATGESCFEGDSCSSEWNLTNFCLWFQSYYLWDLWKYVDVWNEKDGFPCTLVPLHEGRDLTYSYSRPWSRLSRWRGTWGKMYFYFPNQRWTFNLVSEVPVWHSPIHRWIIWLVCGLCATVLFRAIIEICVSVCAGERLCVSIPCNVKAVIIVCCDFMKHSSFKWS